MKNDTEATKEKKVDAAKAVKECIRGRIINTALAIREFLGAPNKIPPGIVHGGLRDIQEFKAAAEAAAENRYIKSENLAVGKNMTIERLTEIDKELTGYAKTLRLI